MVIALLALAIGSYILTAFFFGTLTLMGLILIIESVGPLKYILSRTTKLLDIVIFVFSIIAMATYGLNITAALTVAGVGYTLIYAPYLRSQLKEKKNNKAYSINYRSKFK